MDVFTQMEVINDLRSQLARLRAEREQLREALWKSDPWKRNSDEGYTCQHCGHDYIYMAKTELPDEHHEQDCIWILSSPAALTADTQRETE